MATETADPRDGEVWRSRKGSVRRIINMAEDAYWIQYVRPAPAPPGEALTVLLPKWREWVEREQAVRVR